MILFVPLAAGLRLRLLSSLYRKRDIVLVIPILDCAVIGGGPAGLTAALYLARFLRQIMVIDEGKSRAGLIPESRNFPGVQLSGRELLSRLHAQLADYPACQIVNDRVLGLESQNASFLLTCRNTQILAKRVFLATGIADVAPKLDGLETLIWKGQIRFCPICDAYEATDKRVGLVAASNEGWKKALFLRTYSRNVTLVLAGQAETSDLNAEASQALTDASITVAKSAAKWVRASASGATVGLENGEELSFDVLYPALGCEVHSTLATVIGAKHDEVGCLIVDGHQETSCKGLYAGGDVVSDLHQISVAIGHAAVAATAIHNSLPRNFRS